MERDHASSKYGGDAETERCIEQQIGPRRVGGRYWSHYWNVEYEVIQIDRHPNDGMLWSITVEYADRPLTGTRHCTPWDPRDRVVHQPAEEAR